MRILNLPEDKLPKEKPIESPLIAKEGSFICLFDGNQQHLLQWFNVGFGHLMLFKPNSTNRYLDVRVPYYQDARSYLKDSHPTYKFWECSND